MNSQKETKTLPPRPMRKNALLAFLAGATSIVVVSGATTCRPIDTREYTTLGIYEPLGLEWRNDFEFNTSWEAYLESAD